MDNRGLVWRKSSYSGGDNGGCVEVALVWNKSSHSGGGNGGCVEVAKHATGTAIRDSKAPASGQLAASAPAWRALLTTLQRPEGDLRGI
ncbi:DUF397 domain-containing protein [Amycolatopsis minnesotensis]|uniref:DUF397 domain-containing protein n=1 Tax=Amycolatopsis minnesotensis TaxID=337894 RepID=A0ABP5BVR8_9PSEU